MGGINLDDNPPERRTHDLVMVGFGSSQLEDMLAVVLKTQGGVLTPDPEPERVVFIAPITSAWPRLGYRCWRLRADTI